MKIFWVSSKWEQILHCIERKFSDDCLQNFQKVEEREKKAAEGMQAIIEKWVQIGFSEVVSGNKVGFSI